MVLVKNYTELSTVKVDKKTQKEKLSVKYAFHISSFEKNSPTRNTHRIFCKNGRF
jgi:hypothetical protein